MAIKYRNLLTNILFWIAMIFMAYLAENVIVFDLSNFQREFTLLEYILLFTGIIAILGYFFYNEHKYNGLKLNKLFLIILSIIVISVAIGIFLTPETQYFSTIEIIDEIETSVTKTFVVTIEDKIKSFLFVLITAVGVYIQVIILPRMVSFKRYIIFLLYILVAVSVITGIFSYILDFNSYVHLYNHGLRGYEYPQSYLFNRNMYALALMLGMFALYYIISVLPKWYNHVILVFLLVSIMFTFSKAATGIAIITFIVHFIYRLIATFKKHKKRNIIYLVIMGIVAIFGILLIPFPGFMDFRIFNESRRFILEYYIELGIGSYDGRVEIWDGAINLAKGINLWFGRGLGIFNKTLYFYTGEIIKRKPALFSHNGFIEILGQWGLVGLIPYCLGILAIFILDIYIAIKNYKIGIPALIVFASFLAYTMVETSTLFDPTIEGVATTALVTLPAFSWLYARKHPELNKQIMQNVENYEYKMPAYDAYKFEQKAAQFISLFLGIVSLFAFYYFKTINSGYMSILIFVMLSLFIFMFLPRTLANIYELKKQKHKALSIVLIIVMTLITFSSLFLIAFYQSPFVLIIASQIIILNFVISEKLFNKEHRSFKNYLAKLFVKPLIVLLAILLSGFLIIVLYPQLTWYVISEICALFLIIILPFVSRRKIEDSKLNKKMLVSFSRSLE